MINYERKARFAVPDKIMPDKFNNFELPKKATIKQGKRYLVSNLNKETLHGDMRGWICGHFHPDGSPFKRHDIEVCFKHLMPGEEEGLHYHVCSFCFLLVLDGKVEYQLDNDNIALENGMFYILYPGCRERISKVYRETSIIAIRVPSVPENKISATLGEKVAMN